MASLLTPQAREAFHWLTERMPDSTYRLFAEEVDQAIRAAAARFGFNHELLTAFDVDRIVMDRDPLNPADKYLTPFQAIIFSGSGSYAVIGSGKIFKKVHKVWEPTTLTLADVKAVSLTKQSGTIEIMAKYL
ncbi:hypothetical protein NAD41_002349 [Salmonella enterica]|nr:hypothetical protein [Salmonella enterica]EKK6596317.1 hypothetical protein [Salmonella enterica]